MARRVACYLLLVPGAGIGLYLHFLATESISEGASEPGEYGLFAMLAAMVGLVCTVVVCVVAEVLFRLGRALRSSRRGPKGPTPGSDLRHWSPVLALGAVIVVSLVLLGVRSNSTPTSSVGGRDLRVLRRDGPPETLGGLRRGASTTLPWWEDGVLHVGGTTIRTNATRIATHGGTTVVAKEGPDDRVTPFLVVGDRLLRLPAQGRASPPFVSPDGRLLLWSDGHRDVDPNTDRGESDERLVVYDVASNRIVDTYGRHWEIDIGNGKYGLSPEGIDANGTVLFQDNRRRPRVWHPGSDPAPISTENSAGQSLDPWPRGVFLWQEATEEQEAVGVFGTVSTSGRFHEVGRAVAPTYALWSDSGAGLAYEKTDPRDPGQRTHWWADRIDRGVSVELGVPAGLPFELVGWESDDSVILCSHAVRSRNVLIRCDADSGDCERAGGPTGAGAWMPNARPVS